MASTKTVQEWLQAAANMYGSPQLSGNEQGQVSYNPGAGTTDIFQLQNDPKFLDFAYGAGGTMDPWTLTRYDFFTEGMGIGKTDGKD